MIKITINKERLIKVGYYEKHVHDTETDILTVTLIKRNDYYKRLLIKRLK